jgi:hypothetical protein
LKSSPACVKNSASPAKNALKTGSFIALSPRYAGTVLPAIQNNRKSMSCLLRRDRLLNYPARKA